MKLLRRVWEDIRSGQNLDVYITIIVAAIVALLSILGVANDTVVFSAVLATLALVSSSLLITRHQNEEIQHVLSTIKTPQSIVDQFFDLEYDLAELIQQIRNAKRVYFWGTAFSMYIPLLRDDIKQGLLAGLEVKFLLIKPSSSAVKMAAFRGPNLQEEEMNSNLIRNLSILMNLARKTSTGGLECRVVDYLAPYTMTIFDPHLPNGHLRAHLSTFRLANVLRRPTFELTRKNDTAWFDHFVEQFELIWKESDLYEPEAG